MVRRTMTWRALETLSFDNTYARLPEAFYAKLDLTLFFDASYLVGFHADAEALIKCRRRAMVV